MNKSTFLKHLESKVASLYTTVEADFRIAVSLEQTKKIADVKYFNGKKFETIWKNIQQFLYKKYDFQSTIQISVIYSEREISLDKLLKEVSKEGKNSYSKGIAVGEEFSHIFLPQELQANAIFVTNKNQDSGIDINRILELNSQKKRKAILNISKLKRDSLLSFKVKSVVYDGINFFVLKNGFRTFNAATIENQTTKSMNAGLDYLMNNINSDGKFHYGYSPAKKQIFIGYNAIIHFSAIFSLIEGTNQDTVITDYQEKIEKAITWGLKNLTVLRKDSGSRYVYDLNSNQKKVHIGGQALAIISLIRFSEQFKTTQFDVVIRELQQGISSFGNNYNQILGFPDLEVIKSNQSVIYTGELAYALVLVEKYLNLKEQKSVDLLLSLTKAQLKEVPNHWIGYALNVLEINKISALSQNKLKELAFNLIENHYSIIKNSKKSIPLNLDFLIQMYLFSKKMNGMDQLQLTDMLKTIRKKFKQQLAKCVMYPEQSMYFYNNHTLQYGSYIRALDFRMKLDDEAHYIVSIAHYIELQRYLKKGE